MFTILLVVSGLITGYGFWNMDNVPEPKNEIAIEAEAFAEEDMETLLKHEHRECIHDKKLIKGKNRNPSCV